MRSSYSSLKHSKYILYLRDKIVVFDSRKTGIGSWISFYKRQHFFALWGKPSSSKWVPRNQFLEMEFQYFSTIAAFAGRVNLVIQLPSYLLQLLISPDSSNKIFFFDRPNIFFHNGSTTSTSNSASNYLWGSSCERRRIFKKTPRACCKANGKKLPANTAVMGGVSNLMSVSSLQC